MVPARLRGLIGQGEFWASLGTGTATEARAKAGVLYAALEEIFTLADELAVLERAIAVEAEALAAIEARKAVLAEQVGAMRLLLAEAKHHEATRARLAADRERLARMQVAIGRTGGMLEEARRQGRQAQEALVRAAVAGRGAGGGQVQLPAKPKPNLSTLVEAYFVHRAKVAKATNQVMGQDRGTIRRFIEVCGDRPAGDYARVDITLFLAKLRELPSIYGKSTEDKESTLAEIIARADAADASRLSDKTVKRHLSALAQFLQYAVDEGHLTLTAHADMMGAHRFDNATAARDQRQAWTTEDLTALFGSPVWTGCDPHHRSEGGTEIIRDARFWLPLLAIYHGARLEEFADLYRRDVFCDRGTWAVRIEPSVKENGKDGSAGHERRLKTLNSKRVIPIHREILRMGFVAHVTATAPAPDDPLFPDIKPQGLDGKRGPRVTRWFAEYRRAVGLYKDGVGMHAFRHLAITRLRDAIDGFQQERHVNYLTGHALGTGEGGQRYDKGPGLKALEATLARLSYPELDLAHLYKD